MAILRPKVARLRWKQATASIVGHTILPLKCKGDSSRKLVD